MTTLLIIASLILFIDGAVNFAICVRKFFKRGCKVLLKDDVRYVKALVFIGMAVMLQGFVEFKTGIENGEIESTKWMTCEIDNIKHGYGDDCSKYSLRENGEINE